jgi:hypothetical protein
MWHLKGKVIDTIVIGGHGGLTVEAVSGLTSNFPFDNACWFEKRRIEFPLAEETACSRWAQSLRFGARGRRVA